MPSKSFTFTLEPLLKARTSEEERHQRMVAAIERERLALQDRLRRQQVAIADSKRSLQGSLVGQVRMQDLRMHATSTIALARKAQQAVLELAGVQRRLEAARIELVEASRRRRVIELLRERRFEQWTRALDKAETDVLDELATNAAARERDTARGL